MGHDEEISDDSLLPPVPEPEPTDGPAPAAPPMPPDRPRVTGPVVFAIVAIVVAVLVVVFLLTRRNDPAADVAARTTTTSSPTTVAPTTGTSAPTSAPTTPTTSPPATTTVTTSAAATTTVPLPTVDQLNLSTMAAQQHSYVVGPTSPRLTWSVSGAKAVKVWLWFDDGAGEPRRLRLESADRSGSLLVCPGTKSGSTCTSPAGHYSWVIEATSPDGSVTASDPGSGPGFDVLAR